MVYGIKNKRIKEKNEKKNKNQVNLKERLKGAIFLFYLVLF